MSFFSSLGKFVANEVKGSLSAMGDARDRASSMDDDELIRRFKNASGPEKFGYGAELRSRRQDHSEE